MKLSFYQVDSVFEIVQVGVGRQKIIIQLSYQTFSIFLPDCFSDHLLFYLF